MPIDPQIAAPLVDAIVEQKARLEPLLGKRLADITVEAAKMMHSLSIAEQVLGAPQWPLDAKLRLARRVLEDANRGVFELASMALTSDAQLIDDATDEALQAEVARVTGHLTTTLRALTAALGKSLDNGKKAGIILPPGLGPQQ